MADAPYALRPLRVTDEAWLLHARNSDSVRPYMLSQALITPQEHRRWLEKKLSSHRETPYFIFLEKEHAAGVVGIGRMDKASLRGEWGFYTYPGGMPGTGTRMLGAFLDEMLTRRGLQSIAAQVLGSNARSLHLHRKLGFLSEGNAEGVASFMLPAQDWERKRAAFAAIIREVEIRDECV